MSGRATRRLLPGPLRQGPARIFPTERDVIVKPGEPRVLRARLRALLRRLSDDGADPDPSLDPPVWAY